ncbi:hypothetical protein, partial [Salmonella sp. s55004]|uniref:hypothetical protein n=1 Tax=Salmonella sp. s55004 TaxID=3159675 RepID=UPI003980FC90
FTPRFTNILLTTVKIFELIGIQTSPISSGERREAVEMQWICGLQCLAPIGMNVIHSLVCL